MSSSRNPDKIMQLGMTGISLGAGAAAAEIFPWRDCKSFIDVGCAQGGFTAQAAQAHPQLTGGGKYLVYAAIIDDDRRENAFGLLMSLNMLMETPGGWNR